MVLAILSIVATLAIPAHFGRADVTLRNAAELLVRDVGIAQRLAVGSGKPVELHLASDGYFVTSTLGEILVHPRTGTPFRRDYDRDAVFRGVRVFRIGSIEDRVLRLSPTGTSKGTDAIHLMFEDDRLQVVFDHSTGSPSIALHR